VGEGGTGKSPKRHPKRRRREKKAKTRKKREVGVPSKTGEEKEGIFSVSSPKSCRCHKNSTDRRVDYWSRDTPGELEKKTKQGGGEGREKRKRKVQLNKTGQRWEGPTKDGAGKTPAGKNYHHSARGNVGIFNWGLGRTFSHELTELPLNNLSQLGEAPARVQNGWYKLGKVNTNARKKKQTGKAGLGEVSGSRNKIEARLFQECKPGWKGGPMGSQGDIQRQGHKSAQKKKRPGCKLQK